MPVDSPLQLTVAYAERAGEVDERLVRLSEGATLLDALKASGLLDEHPQWIPATLKTGIWGRRKPLDERVRQGDRVEVYRPLLIDPKEARRRRAGAARSSRPTCSPSK